MLPYQKTPSGCSPMSGSSVSTATAMEARHRRSTVLVLKVAGVAFYLHWTRLSFAHAHPSPTPHSSDSILARDIVHSKCVANQLHAIGDVHSHQCALPCPATFSLKWFLAATSVTHCWTITSLVSDTSMAPHPSLPSALSRTCKLTAPACAHQWSSRRLSGL